MHDFSSMTIKKKEREPTFLNGLRSWYIWTSLALSWGREPVNGCEITFIFWLLSPSFSSSSSMESSLVLSRWFERLVRNMRTNATDSMQHNNRTTVNRAFGRENGRYKTSRAFRGKLALILIYKLLRSIQITTCVSSSPIFWFDTIPSN